MAVMTPGRFPKSVAVCRRVKRRAFVLPLTLFVIALTVLVLTGFARRSLRQADRAVEASRDLQRRWGIISCQRTILDGAEDWLAMGDSWQEATRDAGHRRLVLALGGLEFDLLLGDENAKVNLNTMRDVRRLDQVAGMVVELEQSIPPLLVELRPFSYETIDTVGDQNSKDHSRLSSWGQIFPSRQFRVPAEAPRRIAAATMDVTCWGNGKLNVMRASELAVTTLCRGLDSPSVARRLLSGRTRQQGMSLEELLAGLKLDPKTSAVLYTHLTDESSCYSMWVKVTSPNRSTYEFSVVEQDVEKEDPSTQPDDEVGDHRDDRWIRPREVARFAW